MKRKSSKDIPAGDPSSPAKKPRSRKKTDGDLTAPKRAAKSPRALTPEVMPRDDDEDKDRNRPPSAEESGDLDAASDSELSPNAYDEDWEPSEDELETEGGPEYLPAERPKGRSVVPPAEAEGVDTDAEETSLTAVSPSDPLRRYLEELRRYPLLEPQEEFQLAVRLRDTGDLDAAKRLVQANLRLVVKIAMEYRNFYSNLLDLVQEGNIGLMKAVSKFDPTKGARLGYYASWWIRSYILKYLLDNFRLVKVGTTQAQKKLFYHLMREKERLEAQGLLAGPKLLAERLDVREKDVIEMEQRLSARGSEMSLNAPVDSSGESGSSHQDLLANDEVPVDEQMAQKQLLHLLHDRLPEFEKLLNEKEARILKDRLLAEEPKTLQEVADLYGLTRERARQIEAKVIQKLREYLREHLA